MSRCETGGFNDPFEESLTLQEVDDKQLAEMSFAESLRQVSAREKKLVQSVSLVVKDSDPKRRVASFITGAPR